MSFHLLVVHVSHGLAAEVCVGDVLEGRAEADDAVDLDLEEGAVAGHGVGQGETAVAAALKEGNVPGTFLAFLKMSNYTLYWKENGKTK